MNFIGKQLFQDTYSIPGIFKDLYSLLKKRGDYQKALNTDFADQEAIRKGSLLSMSVQDWIEDEETLNDETSLIYQLT